LLIGSVGCTAIFLIGGFDKDEEPIPIYIRSGDILIMGGKSRLCYHGVPRIFGNTCPPDLLAMARQHDEQVANYLARIRININIRQVMPDENSRKFLSEHERLALIAQFTGTDADNQAAATSTTTSTTSTTSTTTTSTTSTTTTCEQ
jgi:hypothetical protein